MKRFWIILAVVVVGLAALFILTDKKESGDTGSFTGDAKQIQADDHAKNGTDKKITLVEYGDFQCPSCGAYYPIVKQLSEKYKDQVNIIFRHYPIISIHPNAFAAARAAEAASKQGQFWEMHDKLYESQTAWGQGAANQQSLFESYAQELGLDIKQFQQDFASAETAARINRDISSGKQFSISGTPTFILNGEKIKNPANLAAFEQTLEEAIKKVGGTPAQSE